MSHGEPVLVIKNNYAGAEVFRYEGVILKRDQTEIVLEARFNRDDMQLGYAVFRRGDRFVERFYSDRWYNIFEVHDVDDDHLKGWYCNFTRPATFDDGRIEADDLALDLWVYPDRRKLVLDREEFDALPINASERAAVLAALDELMGRL
jgi:protein associated with RNAse G/E